MDRKVPYHVWMRTGNKWEAVSLLPMSQLTAETMAVLLAQERYLPYSDERFCVSVGRPSSGGFEDKAVSVKGCIIDKRADEIIRQAFCDGLSIDNVVNGEDRWHLLQQAGLVYGNGRITPAGREYVESYPKQ